MNNLIKSAAVLFLACVTTQAQETVVIADNYNANSGSTRGFLPLEGVNFNISPPTTRLTGSAAENLRYLYTQETADKKATTQYRITSGKVQVAGSSYSGRFSLSADGSMPFDFSSALGTLTATPANPVVYDVRISMANTLVGNQKFSFGLGTVEGNVTLWDFGAQLYRANVADTVYRVDQRIDTGSTGIADRTVTYSTTETFGTELALRMRFTDAGAESGTAYNSRVQLFMGDTQIYDTQEDSSLINGWRFDGPGRYFIWDQAGASGVSGYVTYDNFSVTVIPEPSSLALGLLAGVVGLIWRRR